MPTVPNEPPEPDIPVAVREPDRGAREDRFAVPDAFTSSTRQRTNVDRRPLTVGDIAGLVAERPRPGRGWRAAVHRASGGRLNPGESTAERDERELLERIRRPVIGDYRVAVLSVKGGVGKTSTTIGLGATFASLRGDRVIAIDANPDFGTLAHRVPEPNPATVRDLLRPVDGPVRRSSVIHDPGPFPVGGAGQ